MMGTARIAFALLVIALSGCRKDFPPKIEVCIADGLGGMDCIEKDGSKLYRPPSQTINYWATNQADQAAFASWCYDADVKTVEAEMKKLEQEVRIP